MLITQSQSEASSSDFFEDVRLSNFKKLNPARSVAHILSVVHFSKPSHLGTQKIVLTYTDKMAAIRFISMCSIVWGHCLLGWESTHFNSVWIQHIQAFFLELGRIGTINFFIISGFFLNDKIQDYTIIYYIKHRFFSLILPWLVFLTLFVIIELFQVMPLTQLLHSSISHNVHLSLSLGKSFIFHSAYWFIPMSMFSAIVLIGFKKHLNKTWFGVSLAGISLFYCINLYYGWVSANHAQSALGYIFFMWLGLQLKAKKAKIKPIINALSWSVLSLTAIVLFIIASREGLGLVKIGSSDAFASNRLSNAILSITVFLLLLKAANIKWISYFKPRKYCFGIYLVHCIVIAQVTPLLNKFGVQHLYINSVPSAILVRLCFFLLVLMSAYILVIAINKTRLRFILGNKQ